MPPELSPASDPLALLGDPVAHSLSPLIHNTALRALGRAPSYVACRVVSEHLVEAVRGLSALGFRGANVTIPHKETVLSLVDRCTPEAEAVGAVNTLCFERRADGITLVGDNTDVLGFCGPLEPWADRIRGRDVLLFGTGGAARAAAYGLVSRFEPARVRVVSRRAARGQILVEAFGLSGTVPWPVDPRDVTSADVLINATPIGMAPAVGPTPIQDAAAFRAGQLVYDLVYTPVRTRLLMDAAQAGATVLGGLPMLVGQAAASFRAWFGLDMPQAPVIAALETALGLDPGSALRG